MIFISARRLHLFTSVLGVYTRLHSVYVNVYIHYFIFKSLSYQYVTHFKTVLGVYTRLHSVYIPFT
jgi:hypothetical protein